jgi:hypothetical protein
LAVDRRDVTAYRLVVSVHLVELHVTSLVNDLRLHRVVVTV